MWLNISVEALSCKILKIIQREPAKNAIKTRIFHAPAQKRHPGNAEQTISYLDNGMQRKTAELSNL